MTWLTRMHLRTWQHQMTTIMQPFQCDLHHRFKKRIELRTQEQPLVEEYRGGTDWTRNDPNRNRRTRGTFHRRLKPLYTEKYKVSCSGFLPKTKPIRTWQHQMTTIMQPFQCDLQTQIQETQRTTHTETTSHCRKWRRNPKRSKPQPAYTPGTFHCRLKLYTQK